MKLSAILVCVGCGSSSPAMPDAIEVDAALVRPGVNDSSKTYQGMPNADESAFLGALRDGDDAARAAAVTKLTADVASDPTNGYSDFLIGANGFIPPTTVLAALASGAPPPAFHTNVAVASSFKQSLTNLADPFYLGFGGALLATIELQTGDTTDATPTLATAMTKNYVATEFTDVVVSLAKNDAATALTEMYAVIEHCNGGALDHHGADAAAYVAKQNASALAHRQCYSDYLGPHGSTGEMLILGDLHALNGDAQAATAYYTALQSSPDYATWPLKPLVERRISGTQAATVGNTAAIAAACTTCHTNALP